MGRRQTTGGVKPAGDRIEVRFTWQGKEMRPTMNLRPTATNLKHARAERVKIMADIKAGTFVITNYFPDYRLKTKLSQEPNVIAERTFSQWCDVWGKLAARDKEHATMAIYKRHLQAYFRSAWDDESPARITHERVLERLAELALDRFDEKAGALRKGLARKTQNNIMIPLRGVFALICKTLAIPDPTVGIDNQKLQGGKPDPFTQEEVEVILTDLRQHDGVEFADYFEFAFFAGLRSSEQIALPWANVDLREHTVLVKEARVMAKDKGRTKTNRERSVELNARAAAVLDRQRARTALQPHGKVFATPEQLDKPFHDEQVQWRVWQRCLKRCKVRYRAPKECRDTSVTMALQAGADPLWVATMHGHSLTTMLKDYARWIPKADKGRNLAAVNATLSTAKKEGTNEL